MSFTTFLALAAPGLLAVAPAALWLLLAPHSPALADAAHGYPLAALLLALLLTWRFQRSRLTAASGALLLVHVALGPWLGEHATNATSAAALLLAPLFALLAFGADRRVGAPLGLAQLGASPVLAGIVATLLYAMPGRIEHVLGWSILDPAYSHWSAFGQPALAGALAGLLGLATVALLRRRSLEASLGWAALAGTLALAAPAGSTARGVWLLAAALCIGIGLIETSYAMAFRDDLTGLPGRRALRELLDGVRAPYSVAVVDIDRFKSFNDRYGHDVGDQVLRLVATQLGDVGGGGRAFRSGGEEFTIVFPGRTAAEALPHVEQLRRDVAATGFTLRRATRAAAAAAAKKRGRTSKPRRQLRVTVSIGLASFGGRNRNTSEVVTSADKAMYRAKQGGRNRVVA